MKDEQNDINEPENSRIFVLYDKNHPISENEFKELFGHFGSIKNIYIVKDRISDTVKGKIILSYVLIVYKDVLIKLIIILRIKAN